MLEYTLIVRDIVSGNKEIVIHSIFLSGVYEQYPKDFFDSKTVGATNRESLRKNLQEKLYRPEISNEILEYIIDEWCRGIKEFYKRRFVLSLEIPYIQSSVVANPIEVNTPSAATYKSAAQYVNGTNLPINVVDIKRSGNPSTQKKQQSNIQDSKSATPSESAQETEPQISSRAATDKWSID